MRVFVISQPKAGTYLTSNLLAALGVPSSQLHFRFPAGYDVYLNGHQHVVGGASFRKGLKRVPEGMHAAGHIPCNRHSQRDLKAFRKILVTRDVEDYPGAIERYKAIRPSVKPLPNYRRLYEQIAAWREHDAVEITFAQLIGRDTDAIDRLQQHLFGGICLDSATAIDSALRADSLTKTLLRP